MVRPLVLGLAVGRVADARAGEPTVAVNCAELGAEGEASVEARQLAELLARDELGVELELFCSPQAIRALLRRQPAGEVLTAERPRSKSLSTVEALLELAAELLGRAGGGASSREANQSQGASSDTGSPSIDLPQAAPQAVAAGFRPATDPHGDSDPPAQAPSAQDDLHPFVEGGGRYQHWGTEAPGVVVAEIAVGTTLHEHWGLRASAAWGRGVGIPGSFRVSQGTATLELEWMPSRNVEVHAGPLVSELSVFAPPNITAETSSSVKWGLGLGGWLSGGGARRVLVGGGVRWFTAERSVVLDGVEHLRVPALQMDVGASVRFDL